jgi:ATP-dependent DNA ligase
MARRDPVGIRLLTRRGNDWSARFPLVVEAVNHLRVRSCLIDGECEINLLDFNSHFARQLLRGLSSLRRDQLPPEKLSSMSL